MGVKPIPSLEVVMLYEEVLQVLVVVHLQLLVSKFISIFGKAEQPVIRQNEDIVELPFFVSDVIDQGTYVFMHVCIAQEALW